MAGRFVLQQRLGRGRYGPIYKALDRSLSEALIGVEHHVALHELHPRIATQPILLERLENLPFHPHAWSHPNLVKLLEFGRDGAKYFLSEEFLEGASVRLVLDDSPWEPLTYDEVLAVLRAVGDALNYAHAKGIVHGDLRPQNVFVTEHYNIKLLDLLPGNEPRPTPFFPEDASNDRHPHPSDDVYGLACLAYELLARRHPYNGNSPLEALTAGLAPQPVPGLPLPQWQALSRGLALRRERRTAGVPELLAGLGITGTEMLRRGKDARPKPAEAPPPAAASRSEPRAGRVARGHRAADGRAPSHRAPPRPPPHHAAVVAARARRIEEPLFTKLAFDAETTAATRPRATRRSSPGSHGFGCSRGGRSSLCCVSRSCAARDPSRRSHRDLGGVRHRGNRAVASAVGITDAQARRAPMPRQAAHRTVHRCRARRRPRRRLPVPAESTAAAPPQSTAAGGADQAIAVATVAPSTDEAAADVRPAELPAPPAGRCNTHFRAAAVRLRRADADGERGGGKRTHRDPQDRIAGRGSQRRLVDCRPYGIGR